jgi:hypothetical protein
MCLTLNDDPQVAKSRTDKEQPNLPKPLIDIDEAICVKPITLIPVEPMPKALPETLKLFTALMSPLTLIDELNRAKDLKLMLDPKFKKFIILAAEPIRAIDLIDILDPNVK